MEYDVIRQRKSTVLNPSKNKESENVTSGEILALIYLVVNSKALVSVLHRKVLSALLVLAEVLNSYGIADSYGILNLLGSLLLKLGDVYHPLLTGSVLGNLASGSGDSCENDLVDNLVSALYFMKMPRLSIITS